MPFGWRHPWLSAGFGRQKPRKSSTGSWALFFLTAPTLFAALRRSGTTPRLGVLAVATLAYTIPMDIPLWFRAIAHPYDIGRSTHLTILVIALALYWPAYKVLLASFFYVWNDRDFIGALSFSWKNVERLDWWRVAFAAFIPACAVLAFALFTYRYSATVPIRIAMGLVSIAAKIWIVSALCAFASTFVFDEAAVKPVSRGRFRIVRGLPKDIKRWMLHGASIRVRFDR